MANYSKASEVIVSATDAINMTNNPDLIVVMAIPDETENQIAVTYWSKDDGMLPPWILLKKAA